MWFVEEHNITILSNFNLSLLIDGSQWPSFGGLIILSSLLGSCGSSSFINFYHVVVSPVLLNVVFTWKISQLTNL